MASFVVGVPLSNRVPRVRRFLAAREAKAREESFERLVVTGQGVVTFTLEELPEDGVTIVFKRDPKKVVRELAARGKRAEDAEVSSMLFCLTKDSAKFYWRVANPKEKSVDTELIEPMKGALPPTVPDNYGIGFSPDNQLTQYWVSIDSWNKTLRFGKGEMRLASVLVEVVYAEVKMLMNNEQDKYGQMKMLDVVEVKRESRPFVRLQSCWAYPVVREPSVAVIEDALYTMDDAASPGYIPDKVSHPGYIRRMYEVGKATFSSLSSESQRLYGNIIGFALEASFITALEYSLRDKDGLGYKILKWKLDHPEFAPESGLSAEFHRNTLKTEGDYTYKEIYLRITLGSAMGDSPGVPYVMEIWPGGCGSPIHNHGGTFAIIKVLAGQIDIDLFRQLPLRSDPDDTLRHLSFQKDQITMITPESNQIHRLQNLKQHATTCVTIQCYSYPDSDVVHDPYFHYVEGNAATSIEGFDPISDYNYRQFKDEVMGKWIADGAPEMTNERLLDMWWQTYVPPTPPSQ